VECRLLTDKQLRESKQLSKHYERWILSFWLMKIKPTVAGITTIKVPQAKLQRKFDKEGVMDLNLFLHSSS